MALRAVVFDLGGELELDVIELVDHGLGTRWEARLDLPAGELERRMQPLWRAGSVGACTEEEVHQGMRERLGMSQEQVEEYMHEMWDWYCGRLNVPLADYFRRLRPRYRTAILSNSFVGARREEQQCHQVEDLCDLIIYSHEVGVAKPDRRIFELTWQRLGVQPEEMLFLDNAPVHVEAARACGIQAILFEDTAQALVALESRLQAAPRECCANEPGSGCSHPLQSQKGGEVLWEAEQRDRDLGSFSRTFIASEALLPIETSMGPSRSRKQRLRRSEGSCARGLELYLDPLVAHQVHAGPSMEAARPVIPSDGF